MLAIANTGFEAARLRVRLDELEVDGACVQMEAETALKAAEEACETYERTVEARASEIRVQWTQWTELEK